MIVVMRSGLARMSSRSAMVAITSLYSNTILSCSSAVSRCSCISRMRWAWASDSRYPPAESAVPLCSPRSRVKPSGRVRSTSARSSICSTSWERHRRPVSFCLASAGEGEALIRAMISSTLDRATASPSRMWARSRALRSSNTVRRVTTSRRCRRKASSSSLMLSSFGWPSTRATMFMPKWSCICVSLYRLLRTTSGNSPRLSSITTRMPDLSDSSRISAMPSSFFSRTSSPMRISRLALFTW